jgi:hypothetical protein
VRGKTVSVRLTKQQAGLLRHWISNARRLDQIVADMERVSHRMTERFFHAARKLPRARKSRTSVKLPPD